MEDPDLGVSALETYISSRDNRTGISKDLQRINGRTQGRSVTTLSEAFGLIGNLCEAISLPRMVADAARLLFKRVHDERLLRGKSKEGICATCVFIAARQARVPRTIKEIHAQTMVTKKVLWHCFKALEQAFSLSSTGTGSIGGASIASTSDRENAYQTTDASDIITRFCSHLDMPRVVSNAAVQLALAVRESGLLAGRQPNTVAGACILMTAIAINEPKQAKDLAPVAGISEGTIQHAYRLLLPHKAKLFRDVAAFKDGRILLDRLPSPASSVSTPA